MAGDNLGQLSKCVHSGGYQDRTVGGVTTPIYTSSSYYYAEGPDGVRYPRYFNVPTQRGPAEKIAALENGEAALVVASGMAAITTAILTLMKSGEHAVVQNDVYGGTFNFIATELDRFGMETSMVQGNRVEDFEARIRDNTRLIYFESPTNPLLGVVDLAGISAMAKRHGLYTIIDNTFASPINQTPLDFGLDMVIHSGTKYLGGHSDLLSGAIIGSRDIMASIYKTAVNLGGVLGAFECSLLERSMKTLGLRVRQHNLNGQAVADFLVKHPRVKKVNYPGLPGHPGHEIAKAQMKGFGGMLSVELDGDREFALKTVNRLKVFSHAISLGGVESLVCFPSLTSHAKMPREEREKLGIGDSVIRISAGIEDTEDLLADLDQALSA